MNDDETSTTQSFELNIPCTFIFCCLSIWSERVDVMRTLYIVIYKSGR